MLGNELSCDTIQIMRNKRKKQAPEINKSNKRQKTLTSPSLSRESEKKKISAKDIELDAMKSLISMASLYEEAEKEIPPPFFLLPMLLSTTMPASPPPSTALLGPAQIQHSVTNSAEIKMPLTPAIIPVITQTESTTLIKRAPATRVAKSKLINPARLANISSAVEDLQKFFKEKKLEAPKTKLMTIGKFKGGIQNLKTLKEKFDTLTSLGLDLKQILQLASNANCHKTLAVFEGYFQDLKILKFTEVQIMKLASQAAGHLNLDAVKTHASELLLSNWGLTHEDIVTIAGHDGGSPNLRGFRELRHDPRLKDFNTAELIRLVGRVTGSKILSTIAANYPRLQSLGFSKKQTLTLSTRLSNITGILKQETALKELHITPQLIFEKFYNSAHRLKTDELYKEIESRRRAQPVSLNISPSPLLNQNIFLEAKRTQNQTVAPTTPALTLNKATIDK